LPVPVEFRTLQPSIDVDAWRFTGLDAIHGRGCGTLAVMRVELADEGLGALSRLDAVTARVPCRVGAREVAGGFKEVISHGA
jgi:hypothetical protein